MYFLLKINKNMKKGVIVCFLLLLNFCAIGGDFTKEVTDFSKVSFSGEFQVHLTKGNKQEVKVVNKDSGLKDENIIIAVKDKQLKIYIKADLYLDEYDLDIYVTYTTLNDIKAKMECIVNITSELKGDFIQLGAETGGEINAAVACKEAEIIASSGGVVNLKGEVDKAELKCSLGGKINAANLVGNEIDAGVKAGGEIACYPIEKLTIDIASGGTVSYKGEPKSYEESIFLGGKIKKLPLE